MSIFMNSYKCSKAEPTFGWYLALKRLHLQIPGSIHNLQFYLFGPFQLLHVAACNIFRSRLWGNQVVAGLLDLVTEEVPTFYSASSWWRCWISPSFTGTPCFRCCTQFLQLSAWERNILYLWSSCHFYSIFAFLMMLSLCSFLSQPSCFCFS